MDNKAKTMDKIVALCKNRGFIFPGSEIYGGLANTWDYGPLGVELTDVGEVMLAAGGARNVVLFNEFLHFSVCESIDGLGKLE